MLRCEGSLVPGLVALGAVLALQHASQATPSTTYLMQITAASVPQ